MTPYWIQKFHSEHLNKLKSVWSVSFRLSWKRLHLYSLHCYIHMSHILRNSPQLVLGKSRWPRTVGDGMSTVVTQGQFRLLLHSKFHRFRLNACVTASKVYSLQAVDSDLRLCWFLAGLGLAESWFNNENQLNRDRVLLEIRTFALPNDKFDFSTKPQPVELEAFQGVTWSLLHRRMLNWNETYPWMPLINPYRRQSRPPLPQPSLPQPPLRLKIGRNIVSNPGPD